MAITLVVALALTIGALVALDVVLGRSISAAEAAAKAKKANKASKHEEARAKRRVSSPAPAPGKNVLPPDHPERREQVLAWMRPLVSESGKAKDDMYVRATEPQLRAIAEEIHHRTGLSFSYGRLSNRTLSEIASMVVSEQRKASEARATRAPART